MNEDRMNIPVVVGIAAGVLTGLVAGIYIYKTSRMHCKSENKIHDSAELIQQCRSLISEIEQSLDLEKS